MPGAGAGREKNEPAIEVEGDDKTRGGSKMNVGKEATELEVEAVLVVGDVGCGTTSLIIKARATRDTSTCRREMFLSDEFRTARPVESFQSQTKKGSYCFESRS